MSDQPTRARSFGGVVDAYDRGRPGYPAEAVAWLVGPEPQTVLELGAGTGKLTEALVAAGHDVHATDPDEAMLARLRRHLPDVPTSVSGAEEIPAPDGAFDVVVVAQAFHWFDTERALPEIARVLRPGGRLALVWNQRDDRIPWARKLSRLIDPDDAKWDQVEQLAEPVVTSPDFGFVEDASFRHWQLIDRESVQDLALSRSSVAVLDDAGRQAKIAEVLALYDDYGRGMDGMQLPYVARCFHATVTDRVRPASPGPGTGEILVGATAEPGTDEPASGATDEEAVTGGEPAETDDVLLIDFR